MKKKRLQSYMIEFIKIVIYCIIVSWKSSPFYTIIRFLCSIITPLTGLAVTFLGKYILDLLAGEAYINNSETMLIFFFLCLFLIAVIRLISGKFQEYCQMMHNEVVNQELSLKLMDKGINADLEFFDNPAFYNKLSAATMDIQHINMVLFNIISAFSAFITFAASISVLVRYDILYGVLMLAAGVPAGVSAVIYTKKLYFLSLSQIEGERKKGYVNSLATNRQYAPSVRLFSIGDLLKKRYSAVWETLFRERRKSIKLRSIVSCLLSFLPELVILYVGIDVSVKVLGKQAPIGDYSLYIGLVNQLWMGIYMLINAAVQIYDNQLRVNNFKSLDAFKNRIINNGRRKLDEIECIEYLNVTFTYPGNTSPSLKNVSFTVDKAEKIVLVGLNGSGKSTLIKLLLRFYDIDDGAIKINGVDIKEYDINDVRRNFSVYFQDDFNYCFSLRDNIAIADDAYASDERIIGALHESGSDDILRKAPGGLDTYLSRMFSETGIELSIGQGQKVALARAFFRRHTALILDEPSSSLDPKSEHELFEHLKILTDGKITIFTSHRLSNVSLADKIIVLDSGEVLEIGTQGELLKNKGRYAELFGYQRDKFVTVQT